ncbi:MAG: alpha/beta hydrolase [Woeseiaceae bacterium]|nr:alpha/beta hydrolase [Woeseiaceae bacterium]
MTKFYVNTGFGQVHCRVLHATRDAGNGPLICLHPAPSSGLYFTTAMPLLNAERHVVAPDYPGYGGSDAQAAPLSIVDYAAAMLELIDDAALETPVDVLGFHTGCLVAVEMVHSRPDAIRRLVLCDIPYFTAEQQAGFRDKMTQPMPVSPELESLAGPWAFNVGSRLNDVPLERAFELFAEHCRAGTRDWFAFDAAFSYDCAGRFATLGADVTCLATQSGLHAPTEAAAAATPGAKYVDVPEVTTAVFESGAEAITKRILEAL